jgi:hypothetical protein
VIRLKPHHFRKENNTLYCYYHQNSIYTRIFLLPKSKLSPACFECSWNRIRINTLVRFEINRCLELFTNSPMRMKINSPKLIYGQSKHAGMRQIYSAKTHN